MGGDIRSIDTAAVRYAGVAVVAGNLVSLCRCMAVHLRCAAPVLGGGTVTGAAGQASRSPVHRRVRRYGPGGCRGSIGVAVGVGTVPRIGGGRYGGSIPLGVGTGGKRHIN